jgi:type VI secretion system secreted protein VgrG
MEQLLRFPRVKSSSDEALYECVLEHELALLNRNFRSAVYTDVTVPEVVTQLMKESRYFEGFNIDFDSLRCTYPRREMIIQWKETDLEFIRRLLAEVGIWFRLENHSTTPTETALFLVTLPAAISLARRNSLVRRSGMTSHDEYVTELEERHAFIPENIMVRSYNYRVLFHRRRIKLLSVTTFPVALRQVANTTIQIIFCRAGIFMEKKVKPLRSMHVCAMSAC